MYLGQIVESADRDSLFRRPRHPYTQALLASVPSLDPLRQPQAMARGELPNPAQPPQGCRFHPRCPQATAQCRQLAPALRTVAAGHRVACHYAD